MPGPALVFAGLTILTVEVYAVPRPAIKRTQLSGREPPVDDERQVVIATNEETIEAVARKLVSRWSSCQCTRKWRG